jgi:hypothetical protein
MYQMHLYAVISSIFSTILQLSWYRFYNKFPMQSSDSGIEKLPYISYISYISYLVRNRLKFFLLLLEAPAYWIWFVQSVKKKDLFNQYFKNMDRSSVNVWTRYRLIDKYMRQPRLMKLNIINIDENYLSSDIVSITFTYFLNPLHSSLKYAIQFFLIDNFQNVLQALNKLVLISHLNPFELLFTVGNK